VLTRLRTALVNKTAPAVRFKTIVDSKMAGADIYNFQPWYAALMAHVTGDVAYCKFAVNQTDAFVQSEETLIQSGQAAKVAGDSYLDVGSIVGSSALVYDWCGAQMTANQRSRWIAYSNQTVWNVWNHTQARWGNVLYPWTGWSVDNPSNNYYYSFLRATMLLGLATKADNPQAQTWLTKFRTEKLANQLIPTFNRDLKGGGSREGTGYGLAMKGLFDLYYWWEKSTGERIADATPHTRESLDKFLHDIAPTLDRVAPTGDHSRESTAALFDYHREYLEILSNLYPTDAMSGVATTLLAQSSVPKMSTSFEAWVDYVYDQANIPAQPLSRLPTAHWAPGTGQFSMRSAWTKEATYANLICGPYSESHAHRDQGSFVLFKGNWLAIDANTNSHSGIVQDENVHNLVRVEEGGSVVTQSLDTSCAMTALADNATYSYGLAKVTPTYAGKPAVAKVEREFLLIKPSTLVVFDRVQTTGAAAKRIWSLNLPGSPSVSGNKLSVMSGSNRLDVTRLAPTGLGTQVVFWPSVNTDITAGTRVDVVDANVSNSSVFLNVLGADGAFSNAVRSDANGQTGAQITLANGNTAVARFSTNGTGGTLDIRSSTGAVITSIQLPTTVQNIPRLNN
jgi:hypothetical protein